MSLFTGCSSTRSRLRALAPAGFLLLNATGQAQPAQIQGRVLDATSGEPLIGVAIFCNRNAPVTSNHDGRFILRSCAVADSLTFYFAGYRSIKREIPANGDLGTIRLNMLTFSGSDVVIAADRVFQTGLSHKSINPAELHRAPSFFGQKDVLKIVQQQPGVQFAQEGTSNLLVRGGNPDQNLTLLDGVPLYKTAYAGGFVSAIHPEAVNQMEFYQGAFPSRFGGRISSVLDVRLKEGNASALQAGGNIGIVSADVFASGPVRNGLSFFAGARRSLLTQVIDFARLDGSALVPKTVFHDFTGKLTWQLKNRSKLSITAYTSTDAYSQGTAGSGGNPSANPPIYYWSKTDFFSSWKSSLVSASYNRVLPSGGTSSLRGFYSASKSANGQRVLLKTGSSPSTLALLSDYRSELSSGLSDVGLVQHWEFERSLPVLMDAGLSLIHHGVSNRPAQVRLDTTHRQTSRSWSTNGILESAAYVTLLSPLKKSWTGNAGFRFVTYSTQGRHFVSLEPRLAVQWQRSPHTRVHAGYSRTTQFSQLISSSGVGAPLELWIPMTPASRAVRSDQVVAGYLFEKNRILAGAEFYVKSMENLAEFREGANFINPSTRWNDQVTYGRGRNAGMEFFWKFAFKRFESKGNYTLNVGDRTFPDLNRGEAFAPKFLRTHYFYQDISFFLPRKRVVNITLHVMNGYRVSLPSGVAYAGLFTPYVFNTNNHPLMVFEDRNNFEVPYYGRLDVSFGKDVVRGNLTHAYRFGFFNLGNRTNVSNLVFRDQSNIDYQFLFPIIPFFSYRILWNEK